MLVIFCVNLVWKASLGMLVCESYSLCNLMIPFASEYVLKFLFAVKRPPTLALGLSG